MPGQSLASDLGRPTKPRLGLPLLGRRPALRGGNTIIEGRVFRCVHALKSFRNVIVGLLAEKMLQGGCVELTA